MKQMYVIIYYRDDRFVYESKPMERISYPPRASIYNNAQGEFDYAVIEERYYRV